MRIAIAIATVGRAELLCRTVDLLADQSRPADVIIISTVGPQDVRGIAGNRAKPQVIHGEKGLCRQRNRALAALCGHADIAAFLDDDFLPAPDFLAQVEHHFRADPRLAGLTGQLLADGAQCGGITLEAAQALIAAHTPAHPPRIRPRRSLYGCNMAVRLAAARGLWFDENLPLYGWQEDVDFTRRLARRGPLIATSTVTGVHLGSPGARTPGLRLGYSQVANIVYLQGKGTMDRTFGTWLMARNLLANALGSLRPTPRVDRRGRLRGNLLAIADCLRGVADPRRVLHLPQGAGR